MTTANLTVIGNVLFKRGNTTVASAYRGVPGEIIIDTTLQTIRIQDGVTAGGQVLATYTELGTQSTLANANAATQTTEINSLRANITAANAAITSLQSNAAIQATLLDTLTGNAATQATLINAINANVTAANSAIQALSANIGTLVAGAPGALDTLIELGNALGNNASFSATVVTWLGNITSNVTAANGRIVTLDANLGTATTNITTLFSNAATQAGNITTLQTQVYANANVAGYLAGNISVTGNIITNALAESLNLYSSVNGRKIRITPRSGEINSDDQLLLVSNSANVGFEKVWSFDTTGNLTLPGVGGAINFANGVNILSTVAGTYANANVAEYLPTYSGNVRAEYLIMSFGGIITTGASPAPSISGFSSISTTGNAPNEGNISASGNLVANRGAYITGNVTAGNISTGTVTLTNGAVIRDTAGDAVAFGQGAATLTQGTRAVAIGFNTAFNTQGAHAIAIGDQTAATEQGTYSIAIGAGAGGSSQGNIAVAIGYQAGVTNQASNTIILNATGSALDQTTANTFTVSPVRNDVSNIGQVMFYNTTSKEVTYGNTINIAGNINAGQFNFANGVNILSTVAGTYSNTNVAAYLTRGTSPIPGVTLAGNVFAGPISGSAAEPGFRPLTATDLPDLSGNISSYLPTYTGNIAGNIVKSGYTWTFSNTGTTTFPTGVRLSNARGANTVNFTTDVDKSFQIETQTSTTGRLWSFGTDGNLTLPQNANINFSNGVSILSAVGAYQTFANANAATQATSINTINNTLTSSNVAIGLSAGSNAQSSSATAVGAFAGYNTQGIQTVAIGSGAGYTNQKQYAVAVGSSAGDSFQGAQAVAIGADAGYLTQGAQAVAIGLQAGQVSQGNNTVAIGMSAGQNMQGISAVAIGFGAGQANQGNNSIILNATGSALDQTTASTFTVAPVRNDVANVAQVMFYNTTSKEVTYGNTISIAGNINASQFNFANGVNILSTVAGTYANTNVASYLLHFDGDIEFTSSTAKIGNVDVITVMDSVRSPAYQFSNGVNILTTVAGTYANANVASYLPTYSGNVRAQNFVGATQAQVGSSFAYAQNAFGAGSDTGGVFLPADVNSNAIVAGYTIVSNAGVTLTVTSASFVAGSPIFVSVSTTPTASSFVYPVTVYSADYSPALPLSTITVGNATISGNVIAPRYLFANGVNILSTVAGTYGNANVTSYFQSLTSLALGSGAGATAQGVGSVALGVNAGNDQGYYAVAIGIGSGRVAQADSAVAIGGEAGWVSQGINSVAVGYRAGTTNQANSSIILNATGANLNATTANTFTVAPVRNDVANVAQVMFYNTTSKEVTYGNTISIAGNITGNTGGFAIGYRDIPQVVFTSNATLALTDAGKHYFSSNSANVITVPNNTVVSFSIGTAISIVQQGNANLTVTPGAGVTMYLAGNSTSSSRRLGNYGMATLMKVGTDTWFINGTGVS